MYESHFGFSGSPFQLNPDPAFYFDSKGHRNALAYLKFGAHQGEGFIVVTGEIGAGKTTLVRTLLSGLDANEVVAAQVVSTQLESGELLQAILMSFGIASSSQSKAHLIGSLEAFLTALAARGKRALLIIDEAQNLRHEAVEELRMLSNFQLGSHGLLQSFLVGQPELRQLLQSKTMEQLRQRVIASCHLGPLAQPETRAYVEHRLRRVGWSNRPEFADDAFDRIHQSSGGVPRKINRLCNRLLLGSFLNGDERITAQLVDQTTSELKSEIGEVAELPEIRERAVSGGGPESTPADTRAMSGAQAGASTLVDAPARPERPSNRGPQEIPDLSERRAKFKLVADPSPRVDEATQAVDAPAAPTAPAAPIKSARLAKSAEATESAAPVKSAASAEATEIAAAESAEAAKSEPPETLPVHGEDPADGPESAPSRIDVQALLSVVPGRERQMAPAAQPQAEPQTEEPPIEQPTRQPESPSTAPAMPMAAAEETIVDARPHIRRQFYRPGTALRHSILCLTETTSDMLKAGALAEAFASHKDLPRVVALHPQSEATLEIDATEIPVLPMPIAGLHFEGLSESFVGQVPETLRLFNDLLNELQPAALLVMGNSDVALACSLLANKQRLPLFRIAGGQRQGTARHGGAELNGALIDKLSDAIYLNRMDGYFTLYREGINSERVQCAGNLISDTLKAILPHVPRASDILARTGTAATAKLKEGSYALVSVPLIEAFQTEPAIERLADLLSEAASEMPVLWPLAAPQLARLQGSGVAARLGLAGVVPCQAPSYLGQLALLGSARCLIAGPRGGLSEEAAAMQVPAVTLILDPQTSTLQARPGADGTTDSAANGAMVGIRSLLANAAMSAPEAPSYWDSGSASRIASHLHLWLPRITRREFDGA